MKSFNNKAFNWIYISFSNISTIFVSGGRKSAKGNAT